MWEDRDVSWPQRRNWGHADEEVESDSSVGTVLVLQHKDMSSIPELTKKKSRGKENCTSEILLLRF